MVNSGMKLASQVTLGDLLVTKTGPAVVVTIERMVTTGLYSPLTTTSTVLVSGVLCSCFAATSQNTIAEGRVASYHGQAHTCFAPVRTFPALLEDHTSQHKVRIEQFHSFTPSCEPGWSAWISLTTTGGCGPSDRVLQLGGSLNKVILFCVQCAFY